MINVASAFVGNCFYTLVDDGVANLLGLQTLRHGTNPFNYLSIRLLGGDPNHGGKSTGSTKNWVEDDTKNYFYLFKDSEFSPKELPSNIFLRLLAAILTIKMIGYRLFARTHTFLSGYNFTAQIIPYREHAPCAQKTLRVIPGLFGGMASLLITPTLRFRFAEIDSMENDRAYNGLAYKTTQKVEAWRIGLFGSLVTGLNTGWFSRVKAHPLKVLTGIVQLAFAVALTILFVHFLIAQPLLTIPFGIGALLA